MSMVQGHWADNKWFIKPDGQALFQGEKIGDQFDLYIEDGIIKRYDGWQVDMSVSNTVRLLWKKDGATEVEWTREIGTQPSLGSVPANRQTRENTDSTQL